MNISLSPETHKLLEERMRRSGLSSPDDAVRLALEAMEQVDIDDLDDEFRRGR